MSETQGELTVRIFRYDPERDAAPRHEVHRVPRRPHMRVLDALNHVYDEGGDSLAHRWYCGTRKCGECALSVNGVPRLGCWEAAFDGMVCEPLTNFPILRDLVVDTAPGEREVMALRPYLTRRRRAGFPEKLPHSRMAAAHRLSKCIECHACTAVVAAPDLEAAGVEWRDASPPAALVRFARFVLDPRDETDRKALARRSGLAELPHYPAFADICPQGLDLVTDALAPARRALFGESAAPPDPPAMRRAFVVGPEFSAFVNLSDALRERLTASGRLVPLSIEGLPLAYRLASRVPAGPGATVQPQDPTSPKGSAGHHSQASEAP